MKALRLLLLAGLLSAPAVIQAAPISLSEPLPTLQLTDGRVLHNVKFVSFGKSGVLAKWDGGQGSIPNEILPAEIRQAFLAAPQPAISKPAPAAEPGDDFALVTARRGFSTHLLRQEKTGGAPSQPPPGVLDLVSYAGPLGPMAAYLSPSPRDGQRHAAIIWLVGGLSNSIGGVAWNPGPPENDQSAAGFRAAGVITMYPSLRGGNASPGYREMFYGEVDDVVAAARYLGRLPYVDPHRIYLGGHSTGGTLALLVAESTTLFRGVFVLGAMGDVSVYGRKVLPYDLANVKETQLRSPQLWLDSIRVPTFVFEGADSPSNVAALRTMADMTRNPLVKFQEIPGGTHFTIIAPLTRDIAQQIMHDEGK